MKSLLFALSLVLATVSFHSVSANEHPLASIRGDQIDLKVSDHAFAGSIKDFVVFGNKDEATGISELTLKKDGQVIRATFKKQSAQWVGGVIEHATDEQSFKTLVEFVKVDQAANTMTIRFNGQEIVTKIESDAFENGHFVNPKYSAEINGKPVSFKLEGGQACYGFSLHLIMMIWGAYLH